MNIASLSKKVRHEILVFQDRILDGLSKPKKKFIDQMLYGILSSKTVLVSKISRALKEPIKLIKTENRLCRNLSNKDLGKTIQKNIINHQKGRIKEDTLLALDFSDIAKGYAKKMEYLTHIRDGSKDEVAKGYNTCQVIGAEGKELIPIYGKLYSTINPEYGSENKEMFEAIDSISKACDNKGIWVIDRGADCKKIYNYMRENKQKFIIRMKQNRDLLTGDYFTKKGSANEVANDINIEEKETLTFKKFEKVEKFNLSYGRKAVIIPDVGTVMYLSVIKGFTKDKPMLLISNKDWSAKKIFKAYLKRWKVEDLIRFTKQGFDLENIRVLKYSSLQNIYTIITLVTTFMMTYLSSEERKKILNKILKVVKVFFKIAQFHYYQLCECIFEIFKYKPKPNFGEVV